LNTGPCIAVRLNANADFFGGTVNVAAKLQALAEGYQIAMSEATYRSPKVAEYLAEQGAELEELSYASPALREPVGVRRWTVYREAEPAAARPAGWLPPSIHQDAVCMGRVAAIPRTARSSAS